MLDDSIDEHSEIRITHFSSRKTFSLCGLSKFCLLIHAF